MPMHTKVRRVAAALAAVGALASLSACIVEPGDPGPAAVTFEIDTTTTANHPISPLIYGTNGAAGLATNRQTNVRLGGNRWTAYNWETNDSNAGSDWCFQNDNFLSASTSPGAAVQPTIAAAQAQGAAAIVTVPIAGYVAADRNGGCDVRNSGPDYLQTRFDQDVAAKGSALSLTPSTSDGAVYQDEYVNWLKATDPSANLIFQLDNEPDLWSSTHAEIHPDPVTYAELALRDVAYAKAIKSVWPTAAVDGPVNYGFLGLVNLQNTPDNGGRNFVDFYLQQMQAASDTAGTRLLDYFDFHWYPEATGGGTRITGADTGAAVVAAREQAPRSLWDPTYIEQSWITDPGGFNYGPIDLLPDLAAKIADNYPGTKLGVSEWNYGGGTDISGAIATADVLGIFGQQQVGLADMWPLNGDERFTYAAFRAFRNYDGAGGSFGDISIPSTSSNVPLATVYTGQDAADHKKLVIVAINKGTTPTTAAIKVRALVEYDHAKVYTITAAGARAWSRNPTARRPRPMRGTTRCLRSRCRSSSPSQRRRAESARTGASRGRGPGGG